MGLQPHLLPNHLLEKMSPADRTFNGKIVPTLAESLAKHAVKREKELQQRCVALLRQRNIFCNYSRMDRRKTDRTGMPDLVFAFPSNIWKEQLGFPLGIPCAMECKSSGCHPTPEQKRVMDQLKNNGWYVEVIYSEEQFLTVLKHLEQLTECSVLIKTAMTS